MSSFVKQASGCQVALLTVDDEPACLQPDRHFLAIGDVYPEVQVSERSGSDLPHDPVLAADDELGLVEDPDERHDEATSGED